MSYLQKRGISTAVIKRCTQLGILYEGSYKKKEPDGKATYIPVCVFVGKDEHGTAKFACMRGIHSDLRKDAYGSDKEQDFIFLSLYIDLLIVWIYLKPWLSCGKTGIFPAFLVNGFVLSG